MVSNFKTWRFDRCICLREVPTILGPNATGIYLAGLWRTSMVLNAHILGSDMVNFLADCGVGKTSDIIANGAMQRFHGPVMRPIGYFMSVGEIGGFTIRVKPREKREADPPVMRPVRLVITPRIVRA